MTPKLPKNITFQVAPVKSGKKYLAILPNNKKVYFGARGYEHYHDSVPVSLGGGKWSHKNHNDKERRKNYRNRHKSIKNKEGKPSYLIRYTPSWFSYYFLW